MSKSDFFSFDTHSNDFELWQAGKKTYETYRFPLRSTDHFELILIERGRLYIEEAHHRYSLSKGHYIVLEPGLVHRGYQEDVVSYFWLQCSGSALQATTMLSDKDKKHDVQLHQNIVFPKTGQIVSAQLQDSFKHYLNDHIGDSPYRLLRLKSHLALILSELGELTRATPVDSNSILCDAVKQYVWNRPEVNHRVEDIAAGMNMNADHLNRVFRKHHGVSIKQFVLNYKTWMAKNLLEESSKSLAEISELLGFSDQFHFSKVFKARVGISPIKHRQIHSAYAR